MQQVVFNKCQKVCSCSECEMHEANVDIVFRDDTNPFNVDEMTVKGYKCRNYGQYNTNCGFKEQPVFIDDVIVGDLAKKHIKIEIKHIARQVWDILDASMLNESDVGGVAFYHSFLDYMVNQGYNDGNFIIKVWNYIEEEYLK